MAVGVLGRPEKPLMPCPQKRTRRLLERAVVHPMVPFTIRLKDPPGGGFGVMVCTVEAGSGEQNVGHGAHARRENRG